MTRNESATSRRDRQRPIRRQVALLLLGTQLLLSCAPTMTALPEPGGDRAPPLKTGDILRIEVWRQPEYSGEFTIGGDGGLVHPLYQQIQVAGLSIGEARQGVNGFLSRYLENAQVVVEPMYSVSVGGEVREPNLYHVSHGTTVAEAIGLAGGPTTRARMDQLRMVRDGVDYWLVLGEELTTFGSIPVISGDQIMMVRESEFSVWRDVVAPVGTLASLVLAIVRIADTTGG